MEAKANNNSNPLMWVAGIAVIVFCGAGTAAIMGWIPTSLGRQEAPQVLAVAPVAPAAPVAQKHSAAPVRQAELVAPDASRSARRHPVADSPAAPVYAANTPPPARCAECGVIEATREIGVKGAGTGLGAVGGAVVGGLLGSQVGGGHGTQVATVLGAVGGGLAGNEVEKRVKTTKSYEITVRMEDGSSRVFTQSTAPAWRNGEHVKIIDGAIRAL